MITTDKLATNGHGIELFLGLGIILAVGSQDVEGLTLDEAVAQQLAARNGLACATLLGNDAASIDSVLIGGLNSICGRDVNQGGNVPSSATGGGASTPTSLPRVIRKRLRDDQKQQEGSAASADEDAVLDLGSGFSVFLSGEFQNLDRTVTKFEDGYDSDVWRAIAGGDYQIPDLLTAGLAFDFRRHSGNFASASGTGFEQNSYGFLAYGSITPVENLFLQLTSGYAAQQNQRNRFASFSEQVSNFNVSGFNESEYDGKEYSISGLTGYDFNFDGYSVGPRVGVDWVRNEYDSYAEVGSTGLELRYAKDHRTSLQSRAGIFTSKAFGTDIGVVVPQVGFDYVHEFANDQRDILVSFVGDTRDKLFSFQNERPDRDFFEINAGASLVLPHGLQTFASYRGIAGHNYYNGHGINFGLRMPF